MPILMTYTLACDNPACPGGPTSTSVSAPAGESVLAHLPSGWGAYGDPAVEVLIHCDEADCQTLGSDDREAKRLERVTKMQAVNEANDLRIAKQRWVTEQRGEVWPDHAPDVAPVEPDEDDEVFAPIMTRTPQPRQSRMIPQPEPETPEEELLRPRGRPT